MITRNIQLFEFKETIHEFFSVECLFVFVIITKSAIITFKWPIISYSVGKHNRLSLDMRELFCLLDNLFNF